MFGLVVFFFRISSHDGVFTDEDGVTVWEDEDGNTTFTDEDGLTGG